MKRVFLSIASAGTALLLAAPVLAERPGCDGGGPKAECMGQRPGGPGPGFGGPGEGFRGPGGPEGHRRGPGGPGAGGPGRFIEKMIEGETAEKLGLEPEQIEALKKGLAEIQKQEAKLREKLEAAGKEQAELLSAEGEIDETAVMKAIEKTGKIRTQMAKLRIQPILLVKSTLTEEQLAASRKLMHERMQKHREEWARRRGEGDLQRIGPFETHV